MPTEDPGQRQLGSVRGDPQASPWQQHFGNLLGSAVGGHRFPDLIVISASTARELERNVGGRLKGLRVRDKVFNETYCMILCVVDPDYEMVTFYHRGIAIPTELSFKELKVSNGKKGPDVAEIMKAYQMGANPTI